MTRWFKHKCYSILRVHPSTKRKDKSSYRTHKRKSGGNSEEVTPVPIPNTVVKLLSADDTWRAAAWESRTSPVFLLLELQKRTDEVLNRYRFADEQAYIFFYRNFQEIYANWCSAVYFNGIIIRYFEYL